MIDPETMKRSVHHWLTALSRLGQGVAEVHVPSGSTLELDDDFLESDDPVQTTEWFQVDGGRFEIYLEDDSSTIRLSNRKVMHDLRGDDGHPLVTWFGHQDTSYELVLHGSERAQATPDEDASVVWFGWDHAHWKTYLFNGSDLIPIAAGTEPLGLDVDVDRIVWMGWDGENLDIFTSGFSHLGETLCALSVNADGAVMSVTRR